jgi:hypothetical protein
MANLDEFWLIQTTSTAEDADTEDTFSLGVLFTQPNPQFEIWLDFPSKPYDLRERGRTDEFRFNINQNETRIPMDLLGPRNFVVATNGSDKWLPASFWVIGQDVEHKRRLLVGIPRWPSNLWFSRDPSEGKERHSLDEAPI